MNIDPVNLTLFYIYTFGNTQSLQVMTSDSLKLAFCDINNTTFAGPGGGGHSYPGTRTKVDIKLVLIFKIGPKELYGLAQKYTLNNHFLTSYLCFLPKQVYNFTNSKRVSNTHFPDFCCFL